MLKNTFLAFLKFKFLVAKPGKPLPTPYFRICHSPLQGGSGKPSERSLASCNTLNKAGIWSWKERGRLFRSILSPICGRGDRGPERTGPGKPLGPSHPFGSNLGLQESRRTPEARPFPGKARQESSFPALPLPPCLPPRQFPGS